MNIYFRTIHKDDFKRLQENNDSISGLLNDTEYPILVIRKDRHISPGDLIAVQEQEDEENSFCNTSCPNSKKLILVQVIKIISNESWRNLGVMLMHVQLIDLSKYEKQIKVGESNG